MSITKDQIKVVLILSRNWNFYGFQYRNNYLFKTRLSFLIHFDSSNKDDAVDGVKVMTYEIEFRTIVLGTGSFKNSMTKDVRETNKVGVLLSTGMSSERLS